MIAESIQWAGEQIGASGAVPGAFHGVSTDTRQLKAGELFFCLVGKTDGHLHSAAALQAGAAAIVVDRGHPQAAAQAQGKALIVDDTLQALGDLARAWRRRFALPVIAIGGSNGKTTTKNLTRAVLSQRFSVLATEANFNNLIGVPWTLFRLEPGHQAAVIEAGMNDFGELGRLTEIVEPTIGLLTNVGLEHLEKLKSIAGVAQAESELFAGLSGQAVALYNAADPFIAKMATPAKREDYGTERTPIWGKVLRAEKQGDRPLLLEVHMDGASANLAMKLPGPHNLSNVLAALAVARQLGIGLAECQAALEDFTPSASRMELIQLKHGVRLIDDCYNANPSSTIASLKTLSDIRRDGKTLAILGEMLELGEYSVKGHREVGAAAAEEKIDYLVAVGPHAPVLLEGALESGMASASLRSYSDTDAAVKALTEIPRDVKWILVKGSRGVHLEKIVQHLKEIA